MSPRTAFLSRLLGLYCILVSLAMLTHKQATVEAVTALVHNPPLLLVVGVIVVTAGLAIVLGHDVWSGGVLPVIVTLIGWVALAKGLLILFLSPEAASEFFLGGLRYEQFFYGYAGVSLLLGLYLTYAGLMRPRAR
jgi:hypothetical protein